jgi:hypothetical protein
LDREVRLTSKSLCHSEDPERDGDCGEDDEKDLDRRAVGPAVTDINVHLVASKVSSGSCGGCKWIECR